MRRGGGSGKPRYPIGLAHQQCEPIDRPDGLDKKRRYGPGRDHTAKGGRAVRDFRGRKQDVAAAASELYVTSKHLQKVNKSVSEPIFVPFTHIFYTGASRS
jgi:hypothetical protein